MCITVSVPIFPQRASRICAHMPIDLKRYESATNVHCTYQQARSDSHGLAESCESCRRRRRSRVSRTDMMAAVVRCFSHKYYVASRMHSVNESN